MRPIFVPMENMLVHALELTHFKNHRASSWLFNPKVNIISGNNGNGKTNVLDALHYLSLTKSYLNTTDAQNITHGESMALLKAKLERKGNEHVLDLGLKKGQKKKVRLDGKEIDRLVDHVGYMPVVMITPMDRDLIIDAAETRRKLMDTTVSQNDKQYLNALMAYNRALTQRNTTLKYFASNRTYDAEMIGLYNDQLAQNAAIIFEARKSFAAELLPLLTHYYQFLSGGKETVGVRYKSTLHESSMQDLLAENEAKDRVLQYTSSGTHRDDLVFHLGEHPIKRVGFPGTAEEFLDRIEIGPIRNYQTSFRNATALIAR